MLSPNRLQGPLVALLVLIAAPRFAQGQPTLDGWAGINRSALQTVYVRDGAGVETTGKLLALSPDSLTLLVDGAERTFGMGQIDRIQKRDSLKNGTIAGAIFGVAMGLLAGGLADCSVSNRDSGCAGFRVAMVALSTGVYAGLGAGIDAMIPGRTTIYAAPANAASRLTARRPSPPTLLHVGLSW